MSENIPDAAAILTPDKLGEDPRVTPRADAPAPPAPEAPAAPPAPTIPDRDGHGVPFDPARHERRLVPMPGGTRWKLRAGVPTRSHKPTGRPPGRPRKVPLDAPTPAPAPMPPQSTPPIAPVAVPPAPAPAPAPIPAASMSTVAPDAPEAPIPGPGSEARVPLTAAECEIAAKAVTNGVLAGARMWRGDHWRADSMEHSELVGSLARVWQHYGLPKIGPLVEWGLVVISFCISAEQRRKDIKSLWNWLLGKKPAAPAAPAAESEAA